MQLDFHGIDLIRGRDAVIFSKGDCYTFRVAPAMLAGGWSGGQGFQWGTPIGTEATMTYSTGLYGGFCPWGSAEIGDRYTAMTGLELKYGYAVGILGRAMISTTTFESYTYASRLAGSPLIKLTYLEGDLLYFSKRGYWSNQDEKSLASDSDAPAFFCGFVAQAPKASNQFMLGIQTSL
jgi:hypothetical protein